MNNENQLALLSSEQIFTLSKKYDDLSKKALNDNSYESDYFSAFLVPTAFLKNPSNFEVCFDKIIFHLDEAYKKSDNESDRRMVSKSMDDLFHKLIYIIQDKIEISKKQNDRNIVNKTVDFFTNSSKVALQFFVKSNSPAGLIKNSIELATGESDLLLIANHSADIINSFAEYLYYKWEIKKDEAFFYTQLAHVYQKILNSSAFKSEFGLVRNTFSRNKEFVLKNTIEQKGLTSAIHLTKYDTNSNEKNYSAKVIVEELIELGRWEDIISFVKMAKNQNLEVLNEIINDAYEGYQINYKESNGKGITPKEFKAKLELEGSELRNFEEKQASTKRKNFIAISIAIVLTLASLVYGYVSSQNSYNELAKIESNRISVAAQEVSLLIENKQYAEASRKINEEIKWGTEESFLVFNFSKKM
jgi:hypothetical protein